MQLEGEEKPCIDGAGEVITFQFSKNKMQKIKSNTALVVQYWLCSPWPLLAGCTTQNFSVTTWLFLGGNCEVGSHKRGHHPPIIHQSECELPEYRADQSKALYTNSCQVRGGRG
uniref:Uncharacterized protein n=1 Tax=Pyxicephalus adspersus TaxID=30357 RepID=A0AAV3AL11_PYXAD|nr:TPA: hypothetical protein GDO54_007886 [Pyxicephalus adspersus]